MSKEKEKEKKSEGEKVDEARGRGEAYGLEDFRFVASWNQRPRLDIYSPIASSISYNF